MNYTDRYCQLIQQATYRRSARTHGLVALLAPYTMRAARLPQQRRAVPTNPAIHAV